MGVDRERARRLSLLHLNSVTHIVMPEADSEQEVYYEDLIVPPTKPERPTTGPKVKETEVKATPASSSAPEKVPAQENAVSNPLKRQRTLMDMFSGSSAKKTKINGPSAAVVSKTKTLNSIPFNLNGFINSLTEEQRDLLGLEIETMGKSWSVSTSPPPSPERRFNAVLNHPLRSIIPRWCLTLLTPPRLKLLHDEIKQPYFIALKKFLREEGVRGANDTPQSCKVYPLR